MTEPTPRIFISYARRDGRDLAAKLRIDLEQRDFTIWQDIIAMEGGEDWWLQIKEAIESVSVMILVLTPRALNSEFVRKEWIHARQVGTPVLPVLYDPAILVDAPRWMTRVDIFNLSPSDHDVQRSYQRLFDQLAHPPERRPRPFTAPGFEMEQFVERPAEFEGVKSHLLDETRQNPVALTTALQGGGGFGKTTLATALCHDEEIRAAFDDGVLWLQFGEGVGEGDQLRLLNAQIRLLGGADNHVDVNAAAVTVRDLLKDRNLLMVLDDVWNAAHIRPFIQSADTAYLITTRLDEVVIDADAEPVRVDELNPAQSLALLTGGLDVEPALKPRFAGLAERCKGWALLLNLINGALKKHARRAGVAVALKRVLEDLDAEGFTTFDRRRAEERNQALDRSLGASFTLLEPDEREQFEQLGIFPEDTAVPATTLACLWGISDRAARRASETFAELSLLKFDGEQIRLHDVIRQVIGARLAQPAAVHRALLDGWGDPYTLPDEYAWRNVAYHLDDAGKLDDLRARLLDFRWLQAKLDATDANALINDCDRFAGADEALRLLNSALTMSSHVLAVDKPALNHQLLGRLMSHRGGEAELDALLTKIETNRHGFTPLHHPPLEQAGGALIRTLAGHTGRVTGCAVSPDGRFIVSASWDNKLKVWDAATGDERFTLAGHAESVNGCAVSPDGRFIVSASWDNKLKVWDAAAGDERFTMAGHAASVTGCAV
jgi:hypothetical protein